MNRILHKEIIPTEDPRLKRHIMHDSKSKLFVFDTTDIVITDVEHECFIDVLDQGQVGSCTGNAAISCINTAPHVQAVTPIFQPDEDGALALYSSAEEVDGDGPYPPKDNGSSGLSICKVLANPYLKIIEGYQWTFTLENALKALTKYPILVGSYWYEGMDNPDATGRVRPTGSIRGGHEYKGYKIVYNEGQIWFRNSWGKQWGLNGDFWMTWEDFAFLLSQRGDVVVLIPLGHNPLPITVD